MPILQGRGCGARGFPGVYASTSGGYDWIVQETCRLSNSRPAFCEGVEIPGTPQQPGDSSGGGGNGGVSFWDWLVSLFQWS